MDALYIAQAYIELSQNYSPNLILNACIQKYKSINNTVLLSPDIVSYYLEVMIWNHLPL